MSTSGGGRSGQSAPAPASPAPNALTITTTAPAATSSAAAAGTSGGATAATFDPSSLAIPGSPLAAAAAEAADPNAHQSIAERRSGITAPLTVQITNSPRLPPVLVKADPDPVPSGVHVKKVPSGQRVFNHKRARLLEYQNAIPARTPRDDPNTKREPLNAIPFLPKSYTANSVKEETILEYVEDFRRQFVQVFPNRRPLFLCPTNEAGIRKFLPTYIRPCQLSHSECYDYEPVSQFVADFLDYLPLDEPTKFPDLVASPMATVSMRVGDCVDFAILLCSLLRGSGYNAYCVAGYAPLHVTSLDQTQTVCPLIVKTNLPDKPKPKDPNDLTEEEQKKYGAAVRHDPVHESKFLAARHKERLDAEHKRRFGVDPAEQEAIAVKAAIEAAAKVHAPEDDSLYGSRAHCWVMILRGKRDIPHDIFIEPTTAAVYPVTNSPYLAIDSVWNEHNYWVHVNPTPVPMATPPPPPPKPKPAPPKPLHAHGGPPPLVASATKLGQPTVVAPIIPTAPPPKPNPLAHVSFDLNSKANWEYVLIDDKKLADKNEFSSFDGVNDQKTGALSTGATGVLGSGAVSGGGTSGGADEKTQPKLVAPEDIVDDRDILDAPVSWCRKIVIDRRLYADRFPHSKKVIPYKMCVAEKFNAFYGDPSAVAVGAGSPTAAAANNPLAHDPDARTGVVLRLTIFEDEARTKPIEYREVFQHRKDKLRQRIRYPQEEKVHEMFHAGRSHGLKDYMHIPGRLLFFEFYPTANVDGLVRRTEFMSSVGTKIIEEFENSDDFLVYRSITTCEDKFNPNVKLKDGAKLWKLPIGHEKFPPADRYIRKITEKYARNSAVSAELDVRKRTHYLLDGTIRLDFHYGNHNVTHSQHLIAKTEEPTLQATVVDPRLPAMMKAQEREEINAMIQIREKNLTEKLKKREVRVNDVLTELERERNNITLEKSIYLLASNQIWDEKEKAHAARVAGGDYKGGHYHHSGGHHSGSGSGSSPHGGGGGGGGGGLFIPGSNSHYLTAFLPPGLISDRGTLVRELTYPEALAVKAKTLAALKERLCERAYIIEQHLYEEEERLEQKLANFKRGAGMETDEEITKYTEAAQFKIEILNSRLRKHEHDALVKYRDMVERLLADDTLRALRQPQNRK